MEESYQLGLVISYFNRYSTSMIMYEHVVVGFFSEIDASRDISQSQSCRSVMHVICKILMLQLLDALRYNSFERSSFSPSLV